MSGDGGGRVGLTTVSTWGGGGGAVLSCFISDKLI